MRSGGSHGGDRRGEDAEQSHLTGSALEAVIPHLVDAGGRSRTPAEAALEPTFCTAAGRAAEGRPGDSRRRGRVPARPGIRRAVLGPDHPDKERELSQPGGLSGLRVEVETAGRSTSVALAIRARVLASTIHDTAQSQQQIGLLLWGRASCIAARSSSSAPGPARGGHSDPIIHTTAMIAPQTWRCCSKPRATWPPHASQKTRHGQSERGAGPDHPYTALAPTALDSSPPRAGQLDAARPLYERAPASARDAGADHRDYGVSSNDLAMLLLEQGGRCRPRPRLNTPRIRERVLRLRPPQRRSRPESPRQLLRERWVFRSSGRSRK